MNTHMWVAPLKQQPDSYDLALARWLSFFIAILIALVSIVGLVFGRNGWYGADSHAATVTVSAGGLLVPGFLAHDVVDLILMLPLLLLTLWLVQRGALIGFLLWPGVLFTVLYVYALYLVGAPFGPLFLFYALLVALSGVALTVLVVAMNSEHMHEQISDAVPARTAGGILIFLVCLTILQDAGGVLMTPFGAGATGEPLARHVWAVDLAIEVPIVLVGALLLWMRRPLGYLLGAGLLLQYGLLALLLAAMVALQPLWSDAPLDSTAIAVLIFFCALCFAPLALFLRAAIGGQHALTPLHG